MEISEALEVVRTQHHAVLATARSDGRPAMTPVLVTVDDAGRVVISTREAAYKVRNLRRDPRAWLCVLPDRFFGGPWITIDGTAEIVSLPDAMEPLVDYYRSISGEHPDWDEYRSAMRQQRRVIVRITPTAAGPDRQG
jgi:PPOX class probable F420-dependent enzyme